MFANRTGPSCHLQCEQLGRCLSQLPRWEGFYCLRAFCYQRFVFHAGTCRHLLPPLNFPIEFFQYRRFNLFVLRMQVPCACHDWLSFFLPFFLPCRVAKLSKNLHASDLTNEIVIPRNISVKGRLPTDDASISYQNTISIGFHGWNDMQRPSTLCSAVWHETMEVSLPCTSPAAPRVIRAPLLSEGSRTTARA